MKTSGLLLFLLLVITSVAGAQPQTPTVFLNEKIRLAQLALGQRATLRYDLRPIGGQHLKVELYHHAQTVDSEPVREWVLHKPYGEERLSFHGLDRAVYTLIAYASDAEGRPLAGRAPLVHVEYGGWRAWEKFKPSVETVEEPPPSFEKVDVATNMRNRDVGVSLSPPAVVVRPGEESVFTPTFRNMEPEDLQWELVGEGRITHLEDGTVRYVAPADQLGTKLFRLEVTSVAHPDLKGGATILVTTLNDEALKDL